MLSRKVVSPKSHRETNLPVMCLVKVMHLRSTFRHLADTPHSISQCRDVCNVAVSSPLIEIEARLHAVVLIFRGARQTRPDPRNAPPGLKPLKKGKITIIIVGETGVGKTAFMNLLANVCVGRPVDQFRREHNPHNESNLDKNQSQTNAAMMYTFERRDGVQLRMLDTPGLCDTRGLEQDKEHKKSIAETIRAHIQTLDAVIIMANGTVERVGPGVEYALHTLAAMFPRSIADNIGFMFTNVPDALSFNFQPDTLPQEIRHSEVWTIQNPVAQFSKYQEAKSGGHSSERQLQSMERLLQNNYVTTVETLNDFFSWLDKREAQPTNAIVDLYDMTGVLAQIDQRERQRMDLKKLQNDLDRNKQVGSICFMISLMHILAQTTRSWILTDNISQLCNETRMSRKIPRIIIPSAPHPSATPIVTCTVSSGFCWIAAKFNADVGRSTTVTNSGSSKIAVYATILGKTTLTSTVNGRWSNRARLSSMTKPSRSSLLRNHRQIRSYSKSSVSSRRSRDLRKRYGSMKNILDSSACNSKNWHCLEVFLAILHLQFECWRFVLLQ